MHAIFAVLKELNAILFKHCTLAGYKIDLKGLSSDLLVTETSHQTLLHQVSVGKHWK